MLQRRTFLGLLAAIAGSLLALIRVVRPSSWWRPVTRVPAQPTTPIQNESGIKITTIRRSIFRRFDGDASDFTSDPEILYIQRDWRRLEGPRSSTEKRKADGCLARIYGPHVVTIVRPDLDQMFELNLDNSEYTQAAYPFGRNFKPQPVKGLTKEELAATGIKNLPGVALTPTFRIETVTKDTGERKQMFGYGARHVITTRKEIPLEGSRREAQEMTTDGWYIDLEPQLYPSLYPSPKPKKLPDGKSAKSGRVHAYLSASVHRPGEVPQAPERPEFIDIGEPEMGFALQEVRISQSTHTLPDGSARQTEHMAETVVTLEKGTYDLALFEVPSGFKRVTYINRSPA